MSAGSAVPENSSAGLSENNPGDKEILSEKGSSSFSSIWNKINFGIQVSARIPVGW